MENLFKVFKQNIKLMIIVLCSVLMFKNLLSTINDFASNPSALIIRNIFDFFVYTAFFGLIVWSLVTDKKNVYNILVPIYLCSLVYNQINNTFLGVGYFRNNQTALIIVDNIIDTFYFLDYGVLCILILYEIITKKELNQITPILVISVAVLIFIRFVMDMVFAIKYEYTWYSTISPFFNLITTPIILLTIYSSKSFFLNSNKVNDEKREDIVKESYPSDNEKEQLEENGIPQ